MAKERDRGVGEAWRRTATGQARGKRRGDASPASGLTPELAAVVRHLVLGAYDTRRRDLPWRGESDPYRTWVSEVMLQQTRVEAVIPYYERWLERFPRLASLAGAREEEVLKAWQGLGYYSRARRLLGAAQVVMERYGGELPASAAELRQLPGVGEYTAGAVASIAFGEVVPAVDGNVRRVLSRLFDLPDPGPVALRELAASLVDPERPGDFNQGLMELGATVCLPRSPACAACLLADLCLARARGTVGERPARKVRATVPTAQVAVVVAVRRGGEGLVSGMGAAGLAFLMRRRPPRGLLAGMWEFPGAEVGGEETAANVAGRLLGALGQEACGPARELAAVDHAFSHLRATYRPFLFSVVAGGEPEGARWVGEEEAAEVLPLPVAQRKILAAAKKAVQESRLGGSFPCGEGRE